MKNILLLNQGHTDNIGDMAIDTVISKHALNWGLNIIKAPYLIQQNKEKKNSKLLNKLKNNIYILNDIINTFKIRRFLNSNTVDYALIGGGELISLNKGFNSAFYCWTKELSQRNIPIYVIGVSGDNEQKKSFMNRYKKGLSRCKYINVRDSHTQKVFYEHYGLQVKLVPDVVFNYRNLIDGKEKLQKSELLVCCPIPYINTTSKYANNGIESYYEFWENLITSNIEEGQSVILTTSVISEQQFVKDFYEWIKLKKEVKYQIYIYECKNVEEFVNILKKSKITISARMHPMILALQYENKIIPVTYKTKLECFKKEYVDQVYLKDEIDVQVVNEMENISKMIYNEI